MMRFVIRPTGEVEAIELSGLGTDDPSFSACVRTALQQLRFPATTDGRAMTVTFPLHYAP